MASAIDTALEGITLKEPPRRDPRLCRGVQSGTYDEQMHHADLLWRMKVIHQLSKPCVYQDKCKMSVTCEYVKRAYGNMPNGGEKYDC